MEDKHPGESKLLYDPMFEMKPDERLKREMNTPKRILFVAVILLFIGASMFLSFRSLIKEKYSYSENDTGYTLSEFIGTKNDTYLCVDSVRDEADNADYEKNVTAVREFAVCCNEYLRFIFIGKDVERLEPHCFYYCKNLAAVVVHPENKSFCSVEGVLFSKDMKEIILHPQKNNEYRTLLKMGTRAPEAPEDVADFLILYEQKLELGEDKPGDEVVKTLADFGGSYKIPETVTSVADSCFSDCSALKYVDLPEGLERVGDFAFFKCTGLESLSLPDTVTSIGADSFSYCEKLTYIFVPESIKTIGHHAFFGCLGCDEIYLEAQSQEGMTIGDDWLPKKEKRSLKNADVLFGQERRGA